MASDPPKPPRLDRLKAQRDQITNQIKALEARRQQQARRDDTRRKIIAGALALEHTEKNPDSAFAKKLLGLIDEYVTRPNERKLFGLEPLPPEASNDDSGDKNQTGLKGSFPK
jgi:hypothetical protein